MLKSHRHIGLGVAAALLCGLSFAQGHATVPF